MGRRSERKLFLFGKYSLALLPPKKWLTELGIKKGDVVTLEFDRSRERIVVRLNTPARPKDQISEGKPSEDTQTQKEDWESIPEL